MSLEKHIPEFVAFANQVADAVAEVHRKYYRQPVLTEYKDDSSPVTQVDRESEMIVRDMIMSHFPDHGILGEEFPAHQPDAEFVWVIDPVDGTKYFMIGQPAFAFLLALSYQGEFILGVIDQAITRERWLGANHYGSFLNGKPIATRHCPALDQCIIARAGYEWHTKGRDHYIDKLWKACHWARWGVAPYDYGLLASGHLDIVITAGPELHDFAPLSPVIHNAGGAITDWYGKPLNMQSPHHVVAVANKDLLPEVIEMLGYEGKLISE